MRKSQVLGALCAFQVVAFNAYAFEELAPVYISANARYDQSIDDVTSFATVITKEQIENIQPNSVAEILETAAGINTSSNGGMMGTTSVFLRGLKAGKEVTVMVDGVAILGDGSGGFSWENLDVNTIERIEIINGAKASAFGEGATAMINIVTKTTSKSHIKLSTGSFGHKKQVVSLAGETSNRFGISMTLIKEKANGFSVTNEKSPSYEDDKDGFKKTNSNFNFWAKPTDNTKMMLKFSEDDLTYDLDNLPYTPNDSSKRTSSLSSLGFNHAVNETWNYQIRTATSKRHEYSSEVKKQNSFIHHLNYKKHKLSLGLDHTSQATNASWAIHESLKTDAYLLSISGKFAGLDYEVGGRKTTHNIFDDYGTNQFGLGYRLWNGFRIKASTGTFTNTPSSYQINGSAVDGVAANPDLTTQTTRTTDYGLAYRYKQIHAEISRYTTSIQNPIIYQSATWPQTGGQYINGDNTDLDGVDVTYRQRFNKNWSANISITKLNYINDATNKAIEKRPDKLNLQIQHDIDPLLRFNWQLMAVGKATDINNKTLDKYELLNLNVRKILFKDWSILLKINNATDAKYENTYGYNTAERSFEFAIQFAPD